MMIGVYDDSQHQMTVFRHETPEGLKALGLTVSNENSFGKMRPIYKVRDLALL